MGVSIPDEFRPDMAMAGEWQVTSERIVDAEEGENKPEAMALGVRKRAPDEEEVVEIEAKKRRWGSTYRTHPTEDEGGLDVLLNNATRKGRVPAVKIELQGKVREENSKDIKLKPGVDESDISADFPSSDEAQKPGIKREPSDGEAVLPTVIDGDLKEEGAELSTPGVVFKKRKAKNIRQK